MLLNTGVGSLNGNLGNPQRQHARAVNILKLGLVSTGTPFDGVPIADIGREAWRLYGNRRMAYAVCRRVWRQRALALKDGRLNLEAANNIDQNWKTEVRL